MTWFAYINKIYKSKSYKNLWCYYFLCEEQEIFILNIFLQHAGEVYGEKAILATELKELQSRLLGLSDERDRSLAILDEVIYNLVCSFEI